MKVLQINAVNKIKSTGSNVSQLNAYLRKAGHTCAVAYSSGPSENPEWEYRIGSKTDAKLHGLLSRLSGKQGYFSKGPTRKLLHFTDAFAPDVVVLNNLHANYIHLPMLLKYLAENDIATVVVLHDCWFYTGKCCHYTEAGCYKWQAGCGNCPALKKYNTSWFLDRTPQMLADKKRLFGAIPRLGVVGVSDWLTGEAKKAPVFANAKTIQRIYNWVDTDTFVPRDTTALRQSLGLQGKKVIMCAASSWSKEKGLDTVLQLANRLSEDCRVLLIGNVPPQTEFGEKILHLPPTYDVQQYSAYYALADVFFQPSPEETFGKVSAEALSCGTPVVCFDSTANPELVGPGCGAVVPLGDMDMLTRQIHKVLAAGKDSFASCCRAFALQNFKAEENLRQYLQLFQALQGKV